MTMVVLGDLGRSPRMQFHALALAADVARVDVVAYAESALPWRLEEHDHVILHPLRTPRRADRLPRALFVVWGALRVAAQALRLLWALVVKLPRPDYVLVQTPPALPTLPVAWLAARLRGARLVVDWHNFGASLLALRLGADHVAVRAAGFVERVAGSRGDAHFCVSDAMRRELAERWGVPDATVLRDRPGTDFAPTGDEERRALFDRLERDERLELPDGPERPAVLVTSSSFTADEDLPLLLDALVRLDRAIVAERESQGPRALPDFVVIVTGKGPLRADFEERLSTRRLRHVTLRCAWLSPEDYPRLLGAADLGISCHRSASGVDLPMKVLDMFGSGLPVCALDYGPCLAELVRDGENGRLFRDAEQLAEQLGELFAGFPDGAEDLERMRGHVRAAVDRRWPDEWAERARPVFTSP